MIALGSFGEAQKREVVYSKDTATEEPVVSKQGLHEGVKPVSYTHLTLPTKG